ncbi:nitrogenase molybdenum-iron protein beta chain (Nitrogenase component I) (Dinitrogenase) [Treponema primitia ZAS-2]|uniref:Nitrogenase molybdenum-iron protein beta chain (Nitrogenase component I) (Dinitrogenase) n=1 Tax=Treponema primitia (strain ATCC BAA-887 / DSM 12427 / ZAS-2) TaxID=545694 RepID=F5YPA9_TREPZ|nr:nitrogenase component 1 [Treponema primitia]AEF83801.1 nitrogenase molybdenum-iron protein beta chain (Nitrogenase component I) (Dinitrogenase) [Treponema primitia ZAS-2]
MTVSVAEENYTSTRNACKLCSPLGACLVLRGIEGCIPLIHGSQGCSTYIRRYGISHFREPLDIASSNFVESTAIFGGRENLFTALDNVTRSYKPEAIGITSTCLAETIGEDVPMYLRQYLASREKGGRDTKGLAPVLFYASTPSYKGTHMDGFHEAILAAVSALAGFGERVPVKTDRINLVSNFVSAEDLRELHSILQSFGVPYTLLPDYSESLDGGTWETYQKLPEGGTKIADIGRMGEAAGTVYLGIPPGKKDAGKWLEENCGVPLFRRELPIGIENNDAFFSSLSEISGKPVPDLWERQRSRLIDAYIDGHKYVNGKRAVIYGEEDFVAALAAFLDEIGVVPVIAATGASNPGFKAHIQGALKNTRRDVEILDDADFVTILAHARELAPDFILGHSKGLYLSRELGIPLIRCGFPVHDRIGGQRILHLGYRGTLNLFDLICNSLMEAKQNQFDKGYTYL